MKRYFQFLLVLVALALVYSGCKKDDTPFEAKPSVKIFAYQTLSGVVVDETGLPVAGVTVFAHGQTYVTGNNGFFLFDNLTVTGDRYIVKFEKSGYFNVTKSELVTPGIPSVIRIAMIADGSPSAVSVTFASGDGGTADIPGLLTVNFPANNFITESGAVYNGNVNVKAAYVDPSLSSFPYFNFGGDQMGENHLDQDVFLKAFVSMFVEITDDAGNHLNLNPSAKASATFELTIPGSLAAAAPDVIETWSFDDNSGLKSANVASPTGTNSTANKTSGRYQGALGHFSYIGCELAYTSYSTVKGHVIDGNGNGVPGVLVTVGQANVITDEQGFYSRSVASGQQIDVGIFPTYFGTAVSTTITPYGNTVVDLNVPTLVTLSGTFVDCDGNPTAANIIIENGSLVIETYTSSGEFAVQVPSSPSVDVYIHGNGAMLSNTIPATADVSFGFVELCPPADPPLTGPMYVYLNGGPMTFVNEQVNFGYAKYGYFSVGAEEFSISGRVSSTSTDDIALHFYGTTLGTYITGTNCGGSMGLTDPPYTTAGFQPGGTMTITRIDEVGGLIEGVYDVYGTSDGVHLTGTFSVVRLPDQP
ncbi:MAG: hypothetical protein A2W91_08730 [Bacteroidetes bacterium GWF2_38_335]|nr:MAG: hypothetical protein A2W91_08730 [Bacteroidetes bacterium GWF2_38_335]OFY80459.1 MAG: hypothetical protein A2281_08455 [Bacteroidetes bacterium RIFOXYA12_FULL_38_20]HBS85935.1 hypothetical protein [Bacteroidales bacterium]